jgi:hypothetical protein
MAEQNESCTGRPRVRLGTPELRGTGVSELTLIATVNEAIKQSISASANISLIAVNANLVAGRAGSRAAGFCVVAGELRRFSDSMALTMQGWSKLIYELVRETAISRNQIHRLHLIQAAGRSSAKAQAALASTCTRSRGELDVTNAHNSERVLELQSLIRRAEKQRVTGEVIARSAMIESAYGGAMRPVLEQIATSIDVSIGNLTAYSRNVGHMMNKVNV